MTEERKPIPRKFDGLLLPSKDLMDDISNLQTQIHELCEKYSDVDLFDLNHYTIECLNAQFLEERLRYGLKRKKERRERSKGK